MPSDPDLLFWETPQRIMYGRTELYPEGIFADGFSYAFQPGVQANVTLLTADTNNDKMAYTYETNPEVDTDFSEVDYYHSPSSWLAFGNTLIPWGSFGSTVRPYQVMRVRVPYRSGTPTELNINGSWSKDWFRFSNPNNRADPQEADGFSMDFTNLLQGWNTYKAVMSKRLPGVETTFPFCEGSDVIHDIGIILLARVELVVFPPNVDRSTGNPEVWQAGRITFGHV